jgi:hypothetical protein
MQNANLISHIAKITQQKTLLLLLPRNMHISLYIKNYSFSVFFRSYLHNKLSSTEREKEMMAMEKLLIVVLCIKGQFILITTFLQALQSGEMREASEENTREKFCNEKKII